MKGLFEYCVRCGRMLTDKESRRRGMGARCARHPKSKDTLEMIERIRQPEFFEGKQYG
jgi:hypothetical protein